MEPGPVRPRVLLSVSEARKRLGIGHVKTFELIGSGALRSVKIGTRRLIPEDALDDFVAELERMAESGRPGAAPGRPAGVDQPGDGGASDGGTAA